MRRISPIGKRRAQGQQAAASGVFLWAVQDGPDQSALQSALHVLVHPHMGRTVQIIERPGTELVYVALIVPQNALHGQRITGTGRLDHRQGQQLPPTESRLLHFGFLLSSSNRFRNSFRALVRCRWTALRDIPTRLPISPSASSNTQYRIKIPCSCSGRLAKAAATSSSWICKA